jgi:hypothetical protein
MINKIFFIFFNLVSLIGLAQTAKRSATSCKTCTNAFLTSVTQLKDIKESDACYIFLQSAVERYGMEVAPCNDSTFGGTQTLTTAMAVQMMASSLTNMDQLVKAFLEHVPKEKRGATEEKLKIRGFDMFNHGFKTVSRIKDLKAADCFYKQVQLLLEKFGIDLTNKQGLLAAVKPANGINMAAMLKIVYGLPDLDVSRYAKPIITKSDFVIMLDMVMDEYNEMVAEEAQ